MPCNNQRIKGLSTIRATRAEEIAAFDVLPREVRKALREATVQISPIGVSQMLRRGGEVEQVIESIALMERKVRHDTAMLPIWGAHHPQEIPTSAPLAMRATAAELDL